MARLVEHVVAGLASGAVDALLAAALVLVYRASGVVNLAQGALATLSAFVCWELVDHGWAYWPAFAATLALSFAGGLVLEGALFRPLRSGPPAGLLLLTVGVLLAVDGLVAWIWGAAGHPLANPFPSSEVHALGVAFPQRELGAVGVAAATLLVLWLLLARTKLGLGLRAAAAGAAGARLAGVPVPALAAVAWGLAAAVGAVAGLLASSSSVLAPDLMTTTILYGLAGAAIGGLDSVAGAVAGGLVVGVGLELLGDYVHWVGGSLRLATAFAVLLAALLVRPASVVRRA